MDGSVVLFPFLSFNVKATGFKIDVTKIIDVPSPPNSLPKVKTLVFFLNFPNEDLLVKKFLNQES